MRRLSFSLSRKALAWLSVLLLLASLLPLYAIAFYNHPFYDDFGFSILTHSAWRESGSLGAVLAAAIQNTVGIRETWEGTYTTSFISAWQPAVFGEGMYWLATVILLSTFLFSLWYFLRQALWHGLRVDSSAFFVLFSLVAFYATQFLPDVPESFFWFNGGVAYTLLWSLMLLEMGLWLRLERTESKPKSMGLFALLILLTVALGGGKYSMVLFAGLCAAGFTLWAFLGKRPKRWLYLSLTLLLAGCLAFSMTAPGNGVRAKTLQGGMSAPMAVAQSLYFGLALMGHWFSLPLAAIALLSAALMLPALRQSKYAFSHPLWVTLLGAGLFCSQLTPTLFTGNYLGDGRILNTYFFTYVLMTLGLVLYWTGWLARKAEAHKSPLLPSTSSIRVGGSLLALVAVLILVGIVGCHPEGREGYGPQNMAGGSAALSLLRGEAQAYDREMDARDAALNDPSQPHVTLAPITTIPKTFMSDALQSHALDYVLSLYAEYYQKEGVSVTPGGE